MLGAKDNTPINILLIQGNILAVRHQAAAIRILLLSGFSPLVFCGKGFHPLKSGWNPFVAWYEAAKKLVLAHTLIDSALALPRILASILENNKTPEGIRVPKVLVPYYGFEMID